MYCDQVDIVNQPKLIFGVKSTWVG